MQSEIAAHHQFRLVASRIPVGKLSPRRWCPWAELFHCSQPRATCPPLAVQFINYVKEETMDVARLSFEKLRLRESNSGLGTVS